MADINRPIPSWYLPTVIGVSLTALFAALALVIYKLPLAAVLVFVAAAVCNGVLAWRYEWSARLRSGDATRQTVRRETSSRMVGFLGVLGLLLLVTGLLGGYFWHLAIFTLLRDFGIGILLGATVILLVNKRRGRRA